jgi:hypothetical protein
MLVTLYFVLYLLALLCFVATAFGRRVASPAVDLLALGLALWVLVELIRAAQALG